MQPIAVGTWCTLCLLSAAAMLVMITLTVDEVVAMGQLLAAQRRRGVSLWHSFWYGANLEGEDRPGPARAKPYSVRGSWWGATWSWPLIGVTGAGVWLLAAPSVTGAAADSDHLTAAIVVTVAVVAPRRAGSRPPIRQPRERRLAPHRTLVALRGRRCREAERHRRWARRHRAQSAPRSGPRPLRWLGSARAVTWRGRPVNDPHRFVCAAGRRPNGGPHRPRRVG